MFNWLKNSRRKSETFKTVDIVMKQCEAELMNEMLAYDVHFSYPRDTPTVPASKIIRDLQDAGHDIPTLICDILAGRLHTPCDDGCKITLVRKW